MTQITISIGKAAIHAADRPRATLDPVEQSLRFAGYRGWMCRFEGRLVFGDTHNERLPERVAAWCRRWERGKPVSPITFRMVLTSPCGVKNCWLCKKTDTQCLTG